MPISVKDKTFAYLSLAGEPFSLSCKLPFSAEQAREMSFVTPTGYGLGKSGWVTASWPDEVEDPMAVFRSWIDESYRAQALKKLIAQAPAFQP